MWNISSHKFSNRSQHHNRRTLRVAGASVAFVWNGADVFLECSVKKETLLHKRSVHCPLCPPMACHAMWLVAASVRGENYLWCTRPFLPSSSPLFRQLRRQRAVECYLTPSKPRTPFLLPPSIMACHTLLHGLKSVTVRDFHFGWVSLSFSLVLTLS